MPSADKRFGTFSCGNYGKKTLLFGFLCRAFEICDFLISAEIHLRGCDIFHAIIGASKQEGADRDFPAAWKFMDSILERKQKRIHELDREIEKAGLGCGWDDGSGTFEVLDRLAEGRASALEQKRADKQPVGRELEVLRMMHERSRLIRDLEAGNNNERGR